MDGVVDMTEDEFIKNLPAFPHEHRVGMTLRDYFAAKAMQGLITSLHSKPYPEWQTVEWISESAYGIADAMLKARGQE